nr:unnamed protein product [Digitaria exilis]
MLFASHGNQEVDLPCWPRLGFALAEKTESMQQLQEDDEVAMVVHERILKQVKMDDYGRYDPSPTMAKPHFKDIPN